MSHTTLALFALALAPLPRPEAGPGSPRDIEQMIERGTFLVPTLAALANILRETGAGIPDYVVEKAARIGETHRASIRAYYDAGGRIAMGTDAGTPFNRHGENAQEVGFEMPNGLSPIDPQQLGGLFESQEPMPQLMVQNVWPRMAELLGEPTIFHASPQSIDRGGCRSSILTINQQLTSSMADTSENCDFTGCGFEYKINQSGREQ